MANNEEYDADMLEIWCDVKFSPIHPSMYELYVEPGMDILTGLPLPKVQPSKPDIQTPMVITTSLADPRTPPINCTKPREPLLLKRCIWDTSVQCNSVEPKGSINTKLIKPPIQVNGNIVKNWFSLKASKTIADVKMRIKNDMQKFTTREGEDIFIPKHIINRINFEKILSTKKKRARINLPERHEVWLHVNKDGELNFYNHKKRKHSLKKGNCT